MVYKYIFVPQTKIQKNTKKNIWRNKKLLTVKIWQLFGYYATMGNASIGAVLIDVPRIYLLFTITQLWNIDKYFHRIVCFGLVVPMFVSCHVFLLSPSYAILPGEQRRSQGSKAVSHRGISTLMYIKKCTSLRLAVSPLPGRWGAGGGRSNKVENWPNVRIYPGDSTHKISAL